MAVRFRNLQGGNPYQGLADTMERVSGRVGSSFMSYGNAVRQRNEKRDQYKAQKERSLVDNMIKLGVAAVGYENQQDALEYKKEQDKLNREFREQESERTAKYRQSMLEETIRGRKVSEELAKDTRQYQSERAKAQDNQWDRMFSLTEDKARKDDAWRVIQGTWRQDDLNRQKELSRLELEHKGKVLGLQEKRLEKTPLEQAKDAAYIASLETKGKKGLKDRLSRSYAHFYGASYGIEGTDTYIPENPSAPGWEKNKKGLDGEIVGGPKISEDEYFRQLGYGGGTADKAFLPTSTEEVFMRYASEDAKNKVNLRPEILADVQPSQEDQHLAEINEGMLKEGSIAGLSATGADEDLNYEDVGMLQTVSKKNPSSLDVTGTEVRKDVASTMGSGSIDERKALYAGMTAEQLQTAMSREDISSSEKALISSVLADLSDADDQGSGVGKVVASEVTETPKDKRVYSENTIMKRDEKGNIVPDEFKTVTKSSRKRNINVRSGPEAKSNEANVVKKLRPGHEVVVTGYQGDWLYVKFIDEEGKEMTGWIEKKGLKDYP